MKNRKILSNGYQIAVLIWEANDKDELGYLARTIDGILVKKYEQLSTMEEIQH